MSDDCGHWPTLNEQREYIIELYRDNATLRARLAEAEAQRDVLLDAATATLPSESGERVKLCRVCGMCQGWPEFPTGHQDDCWLGNAVAQARAARQPEGGEAAMALTDAIKMRRIKARWTDEVS